MNDMRLHVLSVNQNIIEDNRYMVPQESFDNFIHEEPFEEGCLTPKGFTRKELIFPLVYERWSSQYPFSTF